MECQEEVVDLRNLTPEMAAEYTREWDLLFKLNHTHPGTPEYMETLKALFQDMGEGSVLRPPVITVAHARGVHIGKNVFINGGAVFMARGGITIEDGVQIAANVQLISNNHDLYERAVLLCRPVLIKKGAWIGAGATILPGVSVGKHAIVGAGSVVTKDIPDYGVAVGNPARVIRMLDADKFND